MYEPNIDDPRVQRRMKTAFAFTIAWLGPGGRPIGKHQITAAMGNSCNNMGSWLRQHLMICTDYHYNKDTGQTKRWAYNPEGVRFIAEALGYPPFVYNPASAISYNKQLELFYRSYAIEYLCSKFKTELVSGDFNYRDSSNRLWSPLQNLRREIRTEMLSQHGYQYQYDIESCAPALLYQIWQRNQKFSGDLVRLDHIQELVEDRTGIRNQLVVETGIEYDQIKTAITSLFNGARMGTNNYCSLYRELDYDTDKMELLKQNAWIQGLRRDVKNLWTGIAHGIPGIRSIDSSVKWQIYFRAERQVIDQMDNYFRSNKARTFRIHDCLVSDLEVDPSDVVSDVFVNTGYKINLELKRYYSLATQV